MTDALYFRFNGLLLLFSALLFFTSCDDNVRVTHTYTYYEPVYSTTAEIRDAFGIVDPQVIQSAGKIYYLNNYIFLNEPGKGIHMINNTDPSNPVNEAFINIPGNFDMAAKGNVLYADSYIDLLAIDISDLQDVKILKRLESVFPIRYETLRINANSAEEAIVTEYREVRKVDVYEDELGYSIYPGYFSYEYGILASADMAAGPVVTGRSSNSPGIGGSMSRFTIVSNHLFTVDAYNLTPFDITNLAEPLAGNKVELGWDIETIFPYNDQLFVGSQSGMYIVDASDPENPALLTTFTHAQSCDPVIVDNDIAYVTLRSGTECQGFTNQLEVVNVENLTNPVLMKTFMMDNPHGLGKDGDLLFIAEGDFGLKVFNAADPLTIGSNLLKHYENIHAYDVIPLGQILLVTGDDGLIQYDYSDPEDIHFLSAISIANDL